MGVFTFVCRSNAGSWTAKQFEGEIESSASSTYELQRKLVQAATACDSSGGVTSSFSVITPNSAVFQVAIGGAVGGFVGGGAAAAPSGGAAAAAEAPAAEEKKKEEKEESEDEDMGFSLFD